MWDEGDSGSQTYRRRSTASLGRRERRGVLTADQLASAQELALLFERIGADVALSNSAIAARVDCATGSSSYGGESLHRVCLEQAYSAWRKQLPLPRGLVLDMIREDHQLARIASRHHRSWSKAIEMLKDALDQWQQLRRETAKSISQSDVDRAQERIA